MKIIDIVEYSFYGLMIVAVIITALSGCGKSQDELDRAHLDSLRWEADQAQRRVDQCRDDNRRQEELYEATERRKAAQADNQ